MNNPWGCFFNYKRNLEAHHHPESEDNFSFGPATNAYGSAGPQNNSSGSQDNAVGHSGGEAPGNNLSTQSTITLVSRSNGRAAPNAKAGE